jgi:hypothetical protein
MLLPGLLLLGAAAASLKKEGNEPKKIVLKVTVTFPV